MAQKFQSHHHMTTQILCPLEIMLQDPEYSEIKLPYQTALRLFRAVQKLHPKEIAGSMYINMHKKFEYATVRSGSDGSVNHPHEGEIVYHTHPDSRQTHVYYDPPSFDDTFIQISHSLRHHLGIQDIVPQIHLTFTNEGIYTTQVTDPEAIVDLVAPLGATSIDDILDIIDVIWRPQYRQYVDDMLNRNIYRLKELNQLLIGVETQFYSWTQVIKDQGIIIRIKLRQLIKKSYNLDIDEPSELAKPLISANIKPTND